MLAGFSFSNLGGVTTLSMMKMAARRRMEGEELGSVRTVRMASKARSARSTARSR
jgi:hypothetical protein